jgi:hypothetical protein
VDQEVQALANKRITIRLQGSEKDGGDVRLSEFIRQLEAFSEALRQTERALSGLSDNYVYYKVVGLTHNSPATIVLEGVARRKSPVAPYRVMNGFVSGIKGIRNKRRPPQGADLGMLKSYQALAAPQNKHIQSIEIIEPDQKVIPIDSAFSKQVEDIIGPDIFSYGSISGRLERVNFHNTRKFEIFPTVGAQKVTCVFKPELRRQVKDALDNYVTISGRLRYKQWDKHPYAIDAKSIDVHEEHALLPGLHDLRGTSPKFEEGMSSEEFVRSIRDANW